jgi:hypothetical protein
VYADQSIHLDDETAAPTATIKTRELSCKRFVHLIKITSGAWVVAEFTIFSDFDAPLLVTQIDERPGACTSDQATCPKCGDPTDYSCHDCGEVCCPACPCPCMEAALGKERE